MRKALERTFLLFSLRAAQPTVAKVVRGVAWLGPWALPEGPCPVPGTAHVQLQPCGYPSPQQSLPEGRTPA